MISINRSRYSFLDENRYILTMFKIDEYIKLDLLQIRYHIKGLCWYYSPEAKLLILSFNILSNADRRYQFWYFYLSFYSYKYTWNNMSSPRLYWGPKLWLLSASLITIFPKKQTGAVLIYQTFNWQHTKTFLKSPTQIHSYLLIIHLQYSSPQQRLQ